MRAATLALSSSEPARGNPDGRFAAAHVVLNFVNLLRIARRFRAWDEERVTRYLESGT